MAENNQNSPKTVQEFAHQKQLRYYDSQTPKEQAVHNAALFAGDMEALQQIDEFSNNDNPWINYLIENTRESPFGTLEDRRIIDDKYGGNVYDHRVGGTFYPQENALVINFEMTQRRANRPNAELSQADALKFIYEHELMHAGQWLYANDKNDLEWFKKQGRISSGALTEGNFIEDYLNPNGLEFSVFQNMSDKLPQPFRDKWSGYLADAVIAESKKTLEQTKEQLALDAMKQSLEKEQQQKDQEALLFWLSQVP